MTYSNAAGRTVTSNSCRSNGLQALFPLWPESNELFEILIFKLSSVIWPAGFFPRSLSGGTLELSCPEPDALWHRHSHLSE